MTSLSYTAVPYVTALNLPHALLPKYVVHENFISRDSVGEYRIAGQA